MYDEFSSLSALEDTLCSRAILTENYSKIVMYSFIKGGSVVKEDFSFISVTFLALATILCSRPEPFEQFAGGHPRRNSVKLNNIGSAVYKKM